MNKSRLEAYTDAIIAIVVTLLVLEVPRPEGFTFAAFFTHWRAYLVYMITFLQIMGVWYNHHNLFQHAENFNHRFYWANTLWLLILSTTPLISSWLAAYPGHWQPELTYVTLWVIWSAAYTHLETRLLHLNPQIKASQQYTRWLYLILLLAAIGIAVWPMIGLIAIGGLTTWVIFEPLRYEKDHQQASSHVA